MTEHLIIAVRKTEDSFQWQRRSVESKWGGGGGGELNLETYTKAKVNCLLLHSNRNYSNHLSTHSSVCQSRQIRLVRS